MKKLFYFIVLFYISTFSQATNNCDYIFAPPLNTGSAMSWTTTDNYIHAIDIDIENNTIVNFDSAEFYVMSITPSINETANQAKIYLYQDQNGIPGNLISSLDVIPSSVISLGQNGLAGENYKITIPLPFNSVDSSMGGKIWFGYQFKTAHNQHVYQEKCDKTDALGFRYSYNNVWQTSNFETRVKIFKNCTTSVLATNNLANTRGKDFEIYPNPTKGNVFIKNVDVKSIDLYDLNGRKLEVEILDNTVNLSVFPKGLYIIKYTLNNGTVSYKRIIKE